METILIGTYTKKTSEGIYTISLNTDTEKLEGLQLVAKTKNPTYLEYHKETHKLYSVYDLEGRGGTATWNYKNKKAELVEAITQDGAPPCYVHFDPRRGELFDANYHGGFVNVYRNGHKVNTLQYSDGAHAHYAHTHPETGYLYTVDLGNNRVLKYDKLQEVASYNAPEGSGPRHIAFHPNQPYLYIFTEHSSQVIVLRDGKKLSPIQIIDAVPADGIKSGAAIRISTDGKFVYVSNRGHDSITVFKVNDDFTLTKIQNISSYGEHPRDFNLSLSEDYLVVANRDTDNLVLYSRDEQTGLLVMLNDDTIVPEAVNVIFIED